MPIASSVLLVFKMACFACVVALFARDVHIYSTEAALTCNQVVSDLTPCISYVVNGGAVPAQCCNGVRTLWSQGRTTGDRQNICSCLKMALNGIPYTAYNVGLAGALPNKCGLNIPYKISPSTDCKSVK